MLVWSQLACVIRPGLPPRRAMRRFWRKMGLRMRPWGPPGSSWVCQIRRPLSSPVLSSWALLNSFFTHRATAACGRGCSRKSIRITQFLAKDGSSRKTARQVAGCPYNRSRTPELRPPRNSCRFLHCRCTRFSPPLEGVLSIAPSLEPSLNRSQSLSLAPGDRGKDGVKRWGKDEGLRRQEHRMEN